MTKYKFPETDVCVIISVFNDGENLSKAIQSILSQSYKAWSLILINDGSVDDSQKIIEYYQKKDSRIIAMSNANNRGLAYSLNKAIFSTSAKYIARMDADDVAFPNRLGHQLRYLEAHPEIDVLGTGAKVVDSRGDGRVVLKPETHSAIFNSIEKSNPFFHSSVMMRRVFFEDLFGYDEKFLRAQDYDLWLRGIDRFNYYNLQEVLMTYSSKNQSIISILYGVRVRFVNAIRRKRLVVGSLKASLVLIYGLYVKMLRTIQNN